MNKKIRNVNLPLRVIKRAYFINFLQTTASADDCCLRPNSESAMEIGEDTRTSRNGETGLS